MGSGGSKNGYFITGKWGFWGSKKGPGGGQKSSKQCIFRVRSLPRSTHTPCHGGVRNTPPGYPPHPPRGSQNPSYNGKMGVFRWFSGVRTPPNYRFYPPHPPETFKIECFHGGEQGKTLGNTYDITLNFYIFY